MKVMIEFTIFRLFSAKLYIQISNQELVTSKCANNYVMLKENEATSLFACLLIAASLSTVL